MTHFILQSAAILFLAAASAIAQNKPASQETENFRLSMPRVNATVAAYTNFMELLASDPALVTKFKEASKSLGDTNGRDTLSLTAQKMTDPRVGAAFSKAGITPKEAGMTMECLIGVMLGDGMLQGAKADEKKLPAYVTDNLAFYRENKAAVQAALAKFQSVSKNAAKTLGSAEEDEKEDSAEKESEK